MGVINKNVGVVKDKKTSTTVTVYQTQINWKVSQKSLHTHIQNSSGNAAVANPSC